MHEYPRKHHLKVPISEPGTPKGKVFGSVVFWVFWETLGKIFVYHLQKFFLTDYSEGSRLL